MDEDEKLPEKAEFNWVANPNMYVTYAAPQKVKFKPLQDTYLADPIAIAPAFDYGQGKYISGTVCADGSCPVCLAFESMQPPEVVPAVPLTEAIPGLNEKVECPAKCNLNLGKKPYAREIWQVVIHLNDFERWTREQIADWLDTLDADLRFKLPETPEITEGNG